MRVYQTKEIRNIAIVGSTRSGKTTLTEAMIYEGGLITRKGSVEEKNTVSDYRPIELERQSSVVASVLYTEYNNIKINMIDNPGVDDFVGEVAPSLSICDVVFLLLNAQNGIEIGTEINYRNIKKYDIPFVLVVNQLDHERANFEETINQARNLFGKKVTVLQYPVNQGPGFNSVVDILSMKMYKYPVGGKLEIVEIPDSEKAKAEELRNILCENAAESEESLMEKFFDKGELSNEEIIEGLKKGIISKSLSPVLCVSAKNNTGVSLLLDFIKEVIPSPGEMPMAKDINGNEIKCDSHSEMEFNPETMEVVVYIRKDKDKLLKQEKYKFKDGVFVKVE